MRSMEILSEQWALMHSKTEQTAVFLESQSCWKKDIKYCRLFLLVHKGIIL